MKKLLTTALTIIIVTAASAQPSKMKLDSLMDFYASEYNFNGIAFVSYEGIPLVNDGYGYRDIAQKIKNDKNSIFMIGSNTKQFTAEVILQLAMKNKMGLQDKITKYFPDYPKWGKITVENLLTHTSGIPNYTDDTTWTQNLPGSMNMVSIFSVFANKPLEFTPGEKFAYSNSNYILLGEIIEQVSGKKYGQVVKDNILDPLGMTHSGFDYLDLKDPNKATGYYTIQDDTFNAAPLIGADIAFPDGGLYSDAADLFKWFTALRSYTLLPKEWQEKAFIPFVNISAGKTKDEEGYGYGWMINKHNGKLNIGHTGGVPGFYSYEAYRPEENVCVFLIQNCEMPAMDNNTICQNIFKCMDDSTYSLPAPNKIKLSSAALQRFDGIYSISPDFAITITSKENELYAQATDQDAFALKAESEKTFFSKEHGIRIEFKRDTNDQVNKLIVIQGGQEIPAMRK